MLERRQIERRVSKLAPQFPLVDSVNVFVREDRRKTADRRSDRFQAQPLWNQPKKKAHFLLLRYQNNLRELVPGSEGLVLGRHPKCHIVVNTGYTSRLHARVGYCNGEFVLSDFSKNGTYLRTDREYIHRVRQRLPIWGKGLISLGLPISNYEKNLIHFLSY